MSPARLLRNGAPRPSPPCIDSDEFLRPFFPPIFRVLRVPLPPRRSLFRSSRRRRDLRSTRRLRRFGRFNAFRLPLFSRRDSRRILRFSRRRFSSAVLRAASSSSRFFPLDRSRRRPVFSVVRTRRINVASNRTARFSRNARRLQRLPSSRRA